MSKQEAKNYLAYELELFMHLKPEDYFHPINRDTWVVSFCEWLAAKQRFCAGLRASND